jgi:hypothetical protein
MLAARAEQKNAAKKDKDGGRLFGTAAFAGRAGMRGIAGRLLRDSLMVAADLGQVDSFELQSEVHERVCDVSGGLIGDRVFRQRNRLLGRHGGFYP